MQRECALAAFDVIDRYIASGRMLPPVEVGSLVPALTAPSIPIAAQVEPVALPEPAPLVAPHPSAKPYRNPELEAITRHDQSNVTIVRWAIQRMTKDYTVTDITEYLRREGWQIMGAQVSTVLTRLKCRGEIEEVKSTHRPARSTFRKSQRSTEESAKTEPASGSEAATFASAEAV